MAVRRPMTVPARLLERVAQSPAAIAYRRRTGDHWCGEAWQDVLARVKNLAAHLQRLGVRPGDRVVVMLPTSIEWELCHLAVLAIGGTVVGVDAHDAADNIRHIVRTVTPRALCIGSADQRQMLVDQSAPMVTIVRDAATAAGCLILGELLSPPDAAGDSWPTVRPEDAATIIFTSGSTGRPKGVAYTHGQLCLACDAILDRFRSVPEGGRYACWLPLSNLFQRILNLCAMTLGGESYFVENPVEIVARLPEIQPTLFIGVPRFFEKLHAGIENNLAARPAWIRGGMEWALRVGNDLRRMERAGRRPGWLLATSHKVADALFLRRVRALMGPNLQFMVSGSAPLPVWLMEKFHALGWLVLEAYGTSENVVPIAINAPDRYRFGSVGRVLPDNEVRLAEDGELLVRGVGVFAGYFGEATPDSTLDAESFLHTGDFARLDDDGFLWLTGRKSEVFKTSTGRRVAPVPIEARLKQLAYVEHAVVVGRDRPCLAALLCLDPSRLTAGPDSRNPWPPTLLARISADVAQVCADLPAHEQLAGALVTRAPLTIAGGELTSNLKLRRAPIEARYRADFDRLYGELAHRQSQPLIREAS